MPMCECLLDQQQQGPRPSPCRTAVQLAPRLVALYCLAALATWPCDGLYSPAVPGSTNWSTNLMWNVTSILEIGNTTSAAHTPSRDVEHQVEAEFVTNSSSHEVRARSGPRGVKKDYAHLRLSRSPRAGWARDEMRERLQTFADSHILVLGAEQVRYMSRKKPRTFFFSIKATTWLELVLTPCSSNVTWSFHEKVLVPALHGLGFKTQRSQYRKLFSYTGWDRQTFKAKLVPNTYSINVTSLNAVFDSRVFIYLNTAPDLAAGSGLLYPPLPRDSLVKATAKGSNKMARKLEIWWKPAVPWGHGVRLEYCLAINRVMNFRTSCAALASVTGVQRPKQADWGYPERQKSKPKDKDRPVSAKPPKDIFYSCIGNKTSFIYTEGVGDLRLRPGSRYYIDVFVKNKKKDTFSTYKGVSARIKRKTRQILKVGDSRTFKLRPRKRPQVEIRLNETFPKLVLEISSCQGEIPVHIFRNGKRVRRKKVSRYKQIVIVNESPGNFVVRFPMSKRKRKTGRVYSKAMRKRRRKRKKGVTFVTLSLPLQRDPIKAFPKDMSVSVLPYLSGCQNVTLEWRPAGPNQTYCVYRRQVANTSHPEQEVKDVCRSANAAPRHTTLAGCISHHVNHPDRDTLTYNVHGLEPGMCYRFDVLISRRGMASVPYDGVHVRTPAKCNSNKRLSHKLFRCSQRSRRKGVGRRGRRGNG